MLYQSYSVSQRNTKKNGKVWQARLRYKDASGKWKETSKLLPNCNGKREAKKIAEAWFNEMNEAASLSPNISKDKTVEEAVKEYMEYQLQAGEIEPSTYSARGTIIANMIVPYIGKNSFISLDRNAINIWLSKLNAKGLSQGTIGTAFYTVRKVYNYYYNIGELNRNPFQGVKPPKKGNSRITHLTNEQMDYFLSCLENETPKFKLACLLAFYAGLRRGEICGLRWRDVDLNLGTISIQTAIGLTDGGTYTKQPKNRSSIRTFPIVPQLLEELRIQKGDNLDNYFVVGDCDRYLNPRNIAKDFTSFVRKYEIKDAYGKYITLHSLRHNLGAVGIKSGMDIASLSAMFGHSSRAMTLDTYGDATKDAMIIATDKLGKEFGK